MSGKSRPVLSDEIVSLSHTAAALAVGLTGLGDINSDKARDGLIRMAWTMSDELMEIADLVCPPPPAADRIACIKRQVASRIAEIEAEAEDGEGSDTD